MIKIPLDAIPNQKFSIYLDGQACTLKIYERDEHLYLNLTVGQTPIRKGMICVPTAPIIQKPADFKGQLFIIDEYASNADTQTMPRYKGLGAQYNLYYLTEKEYGDLTASN